MAHCRWQAGRTLGWNQSRRTCATTGRTTDIGARRRRAAATKGGLEVLVRTVASHVGQVWASGDQYEPYVGRWSRLVAREFLAWIAVPPDSAWLDVGCGTGALTQ